MNYQYTAISTGGKRVRGKLEAANEEKLFQELKRQNLFLERYTQDVEKSRDLGNRTADKPLPLKELALFCRQISSLLKVGVSLVKALDILYQQSRNKHTKATIKDIYETVQKGSLLSEALRKQGKKFPPIMISLVETGELSGTLEESIAKLATQFEYDLKLRNKVKSAMMYPAILSVLGVGVVILMVVVVLPQFLEMFTEYGVEKLPLPTMMLLGLSELVKTRWYVLVGTVAVGVVLFRTYTKTSVGRYQWDSLKLRIPLIGPVLVKSIVVRFARTVSTLLASGLPILQSLSIVGHVVGNERVSEQIRLAGEDIKKGVPFSASMHHVKLFPPLIHSMLQIGEESGSLDEMMENAASYLNDELENSIQRLVTLIEPILIIIMGVAVGFIIISIMLPMTEIYNAVA